MDIKWIGLEKKCIGLEKKCIGSWKLDFLSTPTSEELLEIMNCFIQNMKQKKNWDK